MDISTYSSRRVLVLLAGRYSHTPISYCSACQDRHWAGNSSLYLAQRYFNGPWSHATPAVTIDEFPNMHVYIRYSLCASPTSLPIP
eukprot:5322624-Amphidinium_carterae.1